MASRRGRSPGLPEIAGLEYGGLRYFLDDGRSLARRHGAHRPHTGTGDGLADAGQSATSSNGQTRWVAGLQLQPSETEKVPDT